MYIKSITKGVDMATISNIPENIETHLKALHSSLENKEVTLDDLKNMWSEKEKLFEKQTRSLGMVEVKKLIKDEYRGFLLLTFSGSLISAYCTKDKFRRIEYASIKLRNDVPDVLTTEKTSLENDIMINNSAVFTEGSIQKTSAIYKVLTFKDDIPKQEMDNRIREATIFLTNGFIKINRNYSFVEGESPDQFDMRSIVKYVATKHNLSQKEVKDVLEDYISILETGLMLSGKASLGNIGHLHTKIKDAQSARVMKVPNGEEIMVSAKPEMYVPKITFSKKLKQKISELEVQK